MSVYGKLYCHETVRTVLASALANNTVAHAYLFSGTEGVGKQTLAWHFAAALLCGKHTLGKGCACSHCHKVREAIHPDLLWVGRDEEERSIKIDDIRGIQSWAMLKPLESSRKICVINQAERMTEEAANAFLKTLEEPPQQTYIVVLAEHVYQLPQTILSRLIEVRLPQLSHETIARIMREDYAGGPESDFLAYHAQGSLGRALALQKNDTREKQNDIIDAVCGPHAERFLLHLAQAKSGSVDTVLEVLLSFLHDVLIEKTHAQGIPFVHHDKEKERTDMARRMTVKQVMHLLSTCEESKRALHGNVNQKLIAGRLAVCLADATNAS